MFRQYETGCIKVPLFYYFRLGLQFGTIQNLKLFPTSSASPPFLVGPSKEGRRVGSSTEGRKVPLPSVVTRGARTLSVVFFSRSGLSPASVGRTLQGVGDLKFGRLRL